MAFKMDGELVLPAAQERVWEGLNDPEVLRQSIKGCQSLERVGENEFVAEVKMKIGPVSSVFSGRVQLCDLDPPNSYRIVGQGDGGAAGFAKGGASVRLSPVEGGTLLRYDVNAEIGGRLAQLGGRLVNGVAKKQADMFFEAFAGHFADPGATPAMDVAGDAAPADSLAGAPKSALGQPGFAQPARGDSRVLPGAGGSPVAGSPPWAWLVALAVACGGGFLLGRGGVDPVWVLVTIAIALASAGAGYGSALPKEKR